MPRPIDHLVIAARDLDAAAASYRRLGFQVGSRNRHPWGTENHIVQLDGTFLELIGLGEGFSTLPPGNPAAPFGNGIARFLERRDGLVSVALRSDDAEGDARALEAVGLGPGATMQFGRTAEAADGTRRDVAFTLAFSDATMGFVPGFFFCRHHRPENFWIPAMQRHPNGARRLIGFAVSAENPDGSAERYGLILGADAGTGTRRLDLGEGQSVEILEPEAFDARFDPEARSAGSAMRIEVDSARSVERRLAAAGVPFTVLCDRLLVPPEAAAGLAVCFEARQGGSDAAPA